MNLFLSILFYTFVVIQAILALYVLVPTIFLLVYGLLKLLGVRKPFDRTKYQTDKNFEFGIIITAHQETKFVVPLVDSILKQEYQGFAVYIVADDCEPGELKYDDPRIQVIHPSPALHSKIKSIHHAIALFKRKHDAIIILDADNLIHPAFLATMNRYFQKGYRVVQADFKPKNTDTDYARMDAIGDMFNFFLEREARSWAGLSAAIWGSGVAVDYDLYTEVQYASFLGGFDKKLQSHLVQRVKRIAFAPEAILFDEKITNAKSLETQRTRWISSYFKYFRESLSILWQGVKKGSFNLFYFGFITLRPPLFILLGGAFLVTIINFFVSATLFYAWLGILACFILSFVAIVAIKGKDIRYIKTMALLPFFVFRQFMALLKLKRAKKSFLKTEHSQLIYIDDLLKK